MKQKLKSGDEVDAICAKPLFEWRPKQRKKVKKALNKRIRKQPIDMD